MTRLLKEEVNAVLAIINPLIIRLSDRQRHFRDCGLAKSPIISYDLSYLFSIKEYVKTGKVRVHTARLDAHWYLDGFSKLCMPSPYRLIEECNNTVVKMFVLNVNERITYINPFIIRDFHSQLSRRYNITI